MTENHRGALFMLAAMAAYAIQDMFLKTATQSLPVGQILILFGTGGLIGFIGIAKVRREKILQRALLSPAILLRIVFESVAQLTFTLALAFTALSSASAILQATPLVVVAGAALFLGEKVGWRRWTAIFAGVVGVILILRPSPSSFEAASLLALIGTLGFAGRDLATRMAPAGIGNATLGICGFAAIIPTGFLLLAFTGDAVVPDTEAAIAMIASVGFGLLAYSAMTAAMRTGDVSVVTPFRYSRLLFSLTLGVVIFGETLDVYMILGSTIIMLAGLYIMVWNRHARSQSSARL